MLKQIKHNSTLLKTGDRVRVDGAQGVVELIDRRRP